MGNMYLRTFKSILTGKYRMGYKSEGQKYCYYIKLVEGRVHMLEFYGTLVSIFKICLLNMSEYTQ